jgi:hypothetical protein
VQQQKGGNDCKNYFKNNNIMITINEI